MPTTQSGNRKPILDFIRYDPRTRGPLLLVVPRNVPVAYEDSSEAHAPKWFAGKTLSQFGEILDRRALTEGGLTALVPRRMITIATDLPKPDPTSGLRPEDRLEILLGSFTAAQWRIAGGDNGIGAGDLTAEQKPVFAGLFPRDGLRVETLEQHPISNDPGRFLWMGTGEKTMIPASGVRLRLRRRVSVQFRQSDRESDGGYSMRLGEDEDRHRFSSADGKMRSVGITNSSALERESTNNDGVTEMAFGQTVVRMEANRPKPNDLPLDTPALGVGIRLDGTPKTVGELLAQCAKETKFPLVADKRLAEFPLAWRVAPGGQTVAVSSVLKLLCRSLTGTFRRLTPTDKTEPIYLLTDDRVGYGTRLARLARWVQQGELAREDLLRAAKRSTAKNDPLSHVRFAADDPLALPSSLKDSVDAAYRTTNADGVRTNPAELPSALRDAIKESFGSISKNNPGLSQDRVYLGTVLTCDYVLPDGQAFEAGFGDNISIDYLRSVARIKPPTVPAPVAPTVSKTARIASDAPRRICVLPLPDGADAVKTLLDLAHSKNFNEVLFRVSLYDARTTERLVQAVEAGKAVPIRVGASAPWLKRGKRESMGTQDENIAGEVGNQAIVIEMNHMLKMTQEMSTEIGADVKLSEETKHIFDLITEYLSGWIVPDARLSFDPLSRTLATPGLSAFVLTDTVAPGWDRETDDPNQGFPGTMLGYTLSTRIACVLKEGFDPVDVPDTSLHLPFTKPELGFGSINLTRPMTAFRVRENRRERENLLKQVAGKATPIYVDQGLSPLSGLPARYERYGRNAVMTADGLAVYQPIMQYEPLKVAEAAVAVTRAASKTGFVIDFGRGSVAEATKYLNAFADM